MLRSVAVFLVALSAGLAAADDLVTRTRIKVQLFAAPAFVSEVSVDAYSQQCLSLDNNLIDGRIQSILIGGHDVSTVLKRDDAWMCRFFDNYDCSTNDDKKDCLVIPDGVNNLDSIGWGTRIHSLMCRNFAPDS